MMRVTAVMSGPGVSWRACSSPRRVLVTLADLHDLLCGLSVSQDCRLPYNVYELLFQPGEPDTSARVRAFKFAKDHGCEVENDLKAQEVRFVKRITNPRCCVNPVPH